MEIRSLTFAIFCAILPSKDSQKIRSLIFMISGGTQKNQALRKLLSSPCDIWRAPWVSQVHEEHTSLAPGVLRFWTSNLLNKEMGSSLNVRVGVLHAQLPLNAPQSISVGYLIESIKGRSTITTLKTSQYNHLQGCILKHTPVGEVLLRNPLYQQVFWLFSLTN
jgi:hypothetical protein